MMNLKDKIKQITVESDSSWIDQANTRAANRGARKNARKIALRVLAELKKQNISQGDLAERMSVSRQQVSKIIKGQENFTLETIDKLESALGISLITVHLSQKRDTSPTTWSETEHAALKLLDTANTLMSFTVPIFANALYYKEMYYIFNNHVFDTMRFNVDALTIVRLAAEFDDSDEKKTKAKAALGKTIFELA